MGQTRKKERQRVLNRFNIVRLQPGREVAAPILLPLFCVLRSLMRRLPSVGFAVVGLGILLGWAGMLATPALADAGAKVYLHKDWQLQSSCEVKAGGEQVSVVGFDAS